MDPHFYSVEKMSAQKGVGKAPETYVEDETEKKDSLREMSQATKHRAIMLKE